MKSYFNWLPAFAACLIVFSLVSGFEKPSYFIPIAKKTPLDKYISDYKYTPFTIPRSDWGVGTVVTFKKKAEEIAAFKDECLTVDEQLADATLSNQTYTISRDNSLELNLSKIVSDKLNLKGAYNDTRLKSVTIHLDKIKEVAASQLTIKRKIKELAEANKQDCLDEIFSKKNIVLVRVLRIESLTYTFTDKNNRTIKLDAQFLDKIGADVNLKKEYEGKSEIVINKPMYVGYRSSQFTAAGGFHETDIKAKDLTPEAIIKMKAASN